MKKLLIALSVILATLVSCTTNTDTSLPVEGDYFTSKPHVIVIDSCEYISWGYGMSHKGNCKFCQQRRQKEYEAFLEDIIIELY